jgi:hypothetical protein
VVVIHRRGIRHEDRADPGGRELRHRRGARARDHEVCIGVGRRHVVDEGAHVRLDTSGAVGGLGGLAILRAGLVQHPWAARLRQQRDRGGHEPVQRKRALAAAEDEESNGRVPRLESLARRRQ